MGIDLLVCSFSSAQVAQVDVQLCFPKVFCHVFLGCIVTHHDTTAGLLRHGHHIGVEP